RGIAHVEYTGDDPSAPTAQVVRDLVEMFLVAIADGEVGAEPTEREGDPPSDADRGAGHDCHAARERERVRTEGQAIVRHSAGRVLVD
ncbi:MAG: hypothetical protein QOF28_2116, partial [Actinomycetota bacterium]|nr:hypothetical protein [Actinomycetota bacterium]